MRRELKAGVGITAVLAAIATGTLIAGSTSSQAAGTPSSAYGLSAGGAIPLDPTPYVESTDGSLEESSVLELPENDVVSLQAATVSAQNNRASVQLVGTSVGGGVLDQLPQLPAELTSACTQLLDDVAGPVDTSVLDPLLNPLGGTPLPLDELPLDDLTDLCETLLTPPDSLLGVDLITVSCRGDSGSVQVAGVELLGQTIDVPSTAPDTTIPADPLLNITINRQTANADGSFTVEGLVVSLLDGTEVITLGSATCGNVTREQPPEAPVPDPVPTHHPVTG
jgi:hypothetical protein